MAIHSNMGYFLGFYHLPNDLNIMLHSSILYKHWLRLLE